MGPSALLDQRAGHTIPVAFRLVFGSVIGVVMGLEIVMIPLISLYFILSVSRTGLITADTIFVASQSLMYFGTVVLLEPERYPADQVHYYVINLCLIAYMAAGAVMHYTKKPVKVNGGTPLPWTPGPILWVMVAVSTLVVIAYFSAVGYSAFFQGLRGLFGGEPVDDIASLRVESYGGSRYLFPGYVNQFKNSLLPALALVLVSYSVHTRRAKFATVVVGFTAVCGLLGTGQRGAFAMAAVLAVTYLYMMSGRRIRISHLVVVASVALPLFALGTAVLGRSGGLVGRLTHSNQLTSMEGFRYIETLDTSWGREWLVSLLGIIPGRTGSTLSNDIFYLMYGSTRGTAPPSSWGSIYYNFGWLGCVILPVVLALVCVGLSAKAQDLHGANSLQIVGLAGLSVVIGTWSAGSPFVLLNKGLLVFIVLYIIGKRFAVVEDKQPARNSRVRAGPRHRSASLHTKRPFRPVAGSVDPRRPLVASNSQSLATRNPSKEPKSW